MYKIYAGKNLIYDSTLEDFVITKGNITKEVNKSGSFTFTIYPDHPHYDRIQKLKTIITVYKGDHIVFRGRVINESIGFYKDKTFTCEGELSFLLDSIQRAYAFAGTPAELFIQFINVHNSQVDKEKQFQIGEITVTDNNNYINRSNSNYEDTLKNINDHLIKTHEGYLHITRGENDVNIINWFQDYPYLSKQNIEFGENLLDFTKSNKGEDIATAIIPLGAKVGESNDDPRLTIESVNNGVDYVYDELAVAKYGWIFKVVTWDNVTVPENLLTKGKAYLTESINQNITIELSAIDLSFMDRSIDSFKLGDYIRIISKPHNIDDKLLLKKQTIDLLKPENDKITLGYTYSSFTDKSLSNDNQNESIIQRVETIEGNYVTNALVASEMENLQSLIDQTSAEISTEISDNYVSNGELTTEIGTLYAQLNNSFEVMFNSLEATVNENDTEARRKFEEIRKYIRFEAGNIILGESNNELILKIENDRIAFKANGLDVAYFSNQKLHITDAEILSSLQVGNFAFIPRANGNLSFKKVR